MAQPKLDIVSLAVAKRIGDEVSTSSADGETATALQRLESINRGRGTVYSQTLNQFEATGRLNGFFKIYPEFLGYESIALNPLPAKVRSVFKVFSTIIYEPVPPLVTMDALENANSKWHKDKIGKRFLQYDGKIILLGVTPQPDTATMLYLRQPEDIAGYGGAYPDIYEPYIWLEMITDAATLDLLHKLQTV